MRDGLTPEFNRLSRGDRLKLKTAAFLTALSEFVRDDTKEHPWRFPFYAAYLALVATPLPFLGASTLILGATYAWTRLEMIDYTRRLNKKINEAFNHEAMMTHYKPYIGEGRVHNKALMKNASREIYKDLKEGGKAAWDGLKKRLF